MDNEFLDSVQIIENKYGIDISKYDDTFLNQIISKRLESIEAKNVNEYLQYCSNNADEAVSLFQSLNITHTEFFRNSLTFAHLEQWILPRLMEEKSESNEVRIWSAGCSSGQEAYSIAMLIENIISKKNKKCRYRIIATDISESALLEANKGEYSEKDIQKIRVKDLNTFFVKSGDRYKIVDSLKQHVSFSKYDLLDIGSAYPHESIFGDFDIVVCSNMLFYYKPIHQLSIVKKLINSLNNTGYLITGEAERKILSNMRDLHSITSPPPIFKKGVI